MEISPTTKAVLEDKDTWKDAATALVSGKKHVFIGTLVGLAVGIIATPAVGAAAAIFASTYFESQNTQHALDEARKKAHDRAELVEDLSEALRAQLLPHLTRIQNNTNIDDAIAAANACAKTVKESLQQHTVEVTRKMDALQHWMEGKMLVNKVAHSFLRTMVRLPAREVSILLSLIHI